MLVNLGSGVIARKQAHLVCYSREYLSGGAVIILRVGEQVSLLAGYRCTSANTLTVRSLMGCKCDSFRKSFNQLDIFCSVYVDCTVMIGTNRFSLKK